MRQTPGTRLVANYQQAPAVCSRYTCVRTVVWPFHQLSQLVSLFAVIRCRALDKNGFRS